MKSNLSPLLFFWTLSWDCLSMRAHLIARLELNLDVLDFTQMFHDFIPIRRAIIKRVEVFWPGLETWNVVSFSTEVELVDHFSSSSIRVGFLFMPSPTEVGTLRLLRSPIEVGSFELFASSPTEVSIVWTLALPAPIEGGIEWILFLSSPTGVGSFRL